MNPYPVVNRLNFGNDEFDGRDLASDMNETISGHRGEVNSLAERTRYSCAKRMALAAQAEADGEVPVGAVLVYRGEIIGAAGGRNRVIGGLDPSLHAEMEAIRKAQPRLEIIDCFEQPCTSP